MQSSRHTRSSSGRKRGQRGGQRSPEKGKIGKRNVALTGAAAVSPSRRGFAMRVQRCVCNAQHCPRHPQICMPREVPVPALAVTCGVTVAAAVVTVYSVRVYRGAGLHCGRCQWRQSARGSCLSNQNPNKRGTLARDVLAFPGGAPLRPGNEIPGHAAGRRAPAGGRWRGQHRASDWLPPAVLQIFNIFSTQKVRQQRYRSRIRTYPRCRLRWSR